MNRFREKLKNVNFQSDRAPYISNFRHNKNSSEKKYKPYEPFINLNNVMRNIRPWY